MSQASKVACTELQRDTSMPSVVDCRHLSATSSQHCTICGFLQNLVPSQQCSACTLRCSVQRIARRSRVLAPGRVERLEALGFDWDGSDPLS